MAKAPKDPNDIPSLASQGRCDHQADSTVTKTKEVFQNTTLATVVTDKDCNTCNTSYTEYSN